MSLIEAVTLDVETSFAGDSVTAAQQHDIHRVTSYLGDGEIQPLVGSVHLSPLSLIRHL